MARRRQRACVCACVAITHACVSRGITLAGGGHGARGAGRKGRNTCTAATQQFRVRCYVSESVMPMWAEANLWSPVSARTCVAFVYVRGTRNSRVTYAGTYRRLRTPLDPSLSSCDPADNRDWIGIGTRAGSRALEEIPRLLELCEYCRCYGVLKKDLA